MCGMCLGPQASALEVQSEGVVLPGSCLTGAHVLVGPWKTTCSNSLREEGVQQPNEGQRQ